MVELQPPLLVVFCRPMRLRLALVAISLVTIGCSDDDSGPAEKQGPVDHCIPALQAENLDSQRAACAFGAGAKVADTIGFTAEMRKKLPIRHVIVMMKENRSFDHLFGEISKAGQPDAEPVPDGFSNPDPADLPVPRYHETHTCLDADPNHQWDAMHAQANGGAMDGFVKSAAATTTGKEGGDGHFVMGYFDQSDLPFYYFLGTTFSLADRYFASALTGTWPNRDYLLAATSDGVKATLGGIPDVPTIFDSMDAAGVSWGVYSNGFPLEGSLLWFNDHAGVYTLEDFFAAAQSGKLPSVSFVDGRLTEDDHPPADMHTSEGWSYQLYERRVQEPDLGFDGDLLHLRRGGRVCRPRAASRRVRREARGLGVFRARLPRSSGRGLSVGEAQLRFPRAARAHFDPALHRAHVRLARSHRARCKQRYDARYVRLLQRASEYPGCPAGRKRRLSLMESRAMLGSRLSFSAFSQRSASWSFVRATATRRSARATLAHQAGGLVARSAIRGIR